MPEGATASIYDRCKAVYGKAAHSYARQKLRGGVLDLARVFDEATARTEARKAMG